MTLTLDVLGRVPRTLEEFRDVHHTRDQVAEFARIEPDQVTVEGFDVLLAHLRKWLYPGVSGPSDRARLVSMAGEVRRSAYVGSLARRYRVSTEKFDYVAMMFRPTPDRREYEQLPNGVHWFPDPTVPANDPGLLAARARAASPTHRARVVAYASADPGSTSGLSWGGQALWREDLIGEDGRLIVVMADGAEDQLRRLDDLPQQPAWRLASPGAGVVMVSTGRGFVHPPAGYAVGLHGSRLALFPDNDPPPDMSSWPATTIRRLAVVGAVPAEVVEKFLHDLAIDVMPEIATTQRLASATRTTSGARYLRHGAIVEIHRNDLTRTQALKYVEVIEHEVSNARETHLPRRVSVVFPLDTVPAELAGAVVPVNSFGQDTPGQTTTQVRLRHPGPLIHRLPASTVPGLDALPDSQPTRATNEDPTPWPANRPMAADAAELAGARGDTSRSDQIRLNRRLDQAAVSRAYPFLGDVNPRRNEGGDYTTTCVLAGIAGALSIREGVGHQVPPTGPMPVADLANFAGRRLVAVDGYDTVLEGMHEAGPGAHGLLVVRGQDDQIAHVLNVHHHPELGVVALDFAERQLASGPRVPARLQFVLTDAGEGVLPPALQSPRLGENRPSQAEVRLVSRPNSSTGSRCVNWLWTRWSPPRRSSPAVSTSPVPIPPRTTRSVPCFPSCPAGPWWPSTATPINSWSATASPALRRSPRRYCAWDRS
jgi:hypothetical protein